MLNYAEKKAYNCAIYEKNRIAKSFYFGKPPIPTDAKAQKSDRKILGYNCEKNTVTLEKKSFPIYSSKDIGLRYPRKYNIEGFLLEYPGYDKKLGYYRVTAKQITHEKIDPKIFDLQSFRIIKPFAKGRFTKRKGKKEQIFDQAKKNIGKKAPNFTVKTIDGNKISSKKVLKEKIIVLNFWYIKCGPCRKEIPQLNELKNKYKDKNVEFIAISTDPKSVVKNYLEKQNFEYNVVANRKNLAIEFGIKAFPTHIIIDKKGTFQLYKIGATKNIVDELSDSIDKTLKNNP